MILVLSSSLDPGSKSRILAREAERVLQAEGHATAWLDLREHPLPMCDADASYAHPNVAHAYRMIEAADSILIATAIYNYDANAALKNLIELTGGAWKNKIAGFLCAAGGNSSYMSIMSVANSLMLDFRTVIVPRFVYATGDAFSEGRIASAVVNDRVAELARATVRMGTLLKPA